jgi:hypothetical protein
VIHVKIEVESEQVPREFYDIVVSISERLEEFGVPQHDICRALDRVEQAVVQALASCEEEVDESDDDSDDEDECDDEETREG